MNDIELAQLFVSLAEHNQTVAVLQETIEKELLVRGEGMKMAGIEAKYFKSGYETPDYENAVKSFIPVDFDISPYSTTTTTVKWKEIAELLKVEVPQGKPKEARIKFNFK